jgi:hypothetical protein
LTSAVVEMRLVDVFTGVLYTGRVSSF